MALEKSWACRQGRVTADLWQQVWRAQGGGQWPVGGPRSRPAGDTWASWEPITDVSIFCFIFSLTVTFTVRRTGGLRKSGCAFWQACSSLIPRTQRHLVLSWLRRPPLGLRWARSSWPGDDSPHPSPQFMFSHLPAPCLSFPLRPHSPRHLLVFLREAPSGGYAASQALYVLTCKMKVSDQVLLKPECANGSLRMLTYRLWFRIRTLGWGPKSLWIWQTHRWFQCC